MTGFLSKFFGGKKKDKSGIEGLVQDTLEELIEKAQFELSFDLKIEEEAPDRKKIFIELHGADEDLVKDREGQMLEALQLFLKRVVQHREPEDQTAIYIDCGGYREESEAALIDLAEKLKGVVIEKGKSVYFRALSPKDRKVVHQYLSGDQRVKSRSVGEGVFKKIKIYLAQTPDGNESHSPRE